MTDPVILLAGVPYRLKWNRRAMFRADALGGCYSDSQEGSIGLARCAKLILAMLPDEGRAKFRTAEDVVDAMPSLVESWEVVAAALKAGEADQKNVLGSTTGPSSSPSNS